MNWKKTALGAFVVCVFGVVVARTISAALGIDPGTPDWRIALGLASCTVFVYSAVCA